MSELRQNPATKEWVIIAPDRKKRPNDFKSTIDARKRPSHKSDCPFCPGNEYMTQNHIFTISSDQTNNWAVRVIPNRFPALISEGSYVRKRITNYYQKMDALGSHEVVVETPIHNTTIGLMPEEQVKRILTTYKNRSHNLCNIKHYKLVTIFRNYGEAAGTSLEHPHSQIIATPIVPNTIRYPIEEAMRYYDDMGACVYCDMINNELLARDRIVLQGRKFIVFEPFASRMPYETWIMPIAHAAAFNSINSEELDELAHILSHLLKIFYEKLKDPAYNYVIQSVPCNSENNMFFHWSLIILPRLAQSAGFELGSGMHINNKLPEECAAFLRGEID